METVVLVLRALVGGAAMLLALWRLVRFSATVREFARMGYRAPRKATIVFILAGLIGGGMTFVGLIVPLGAALILAVALNDLTAGRRDGPLWRHPPSLLHLGQIVGALFLPIFAPGPLALDRMFDLEVGNLAVAGFSWVLGGLGGAAGPVLRDTAAAQKAARDLGLDMDVDEIGDAGGEEDMEFARTPNPPVDPIVPETATDPAENTEGDSPANPTAKLDAGERRDQHEAAVEEEEDEETVREDRRDAGDEDEDGGEDRGEAEDRDDDPAEDQGQGDDNGGMEPFEPSPNPPVAPLTSETATNPAAETEGESAENPTKKLEEEGGADDEGTYDLVDPREEGQSGAEAVDTARDATTEDYEDLLGRGEEERAAGGDDDAPSEAAGVASSEDATDGAGDEPADEAAEAAEEERTTEGAVEGEPEQAAERREELDDASGDEATGRDEPDDAATPRDGDGRGDDDGLLDRARRLLRRLGGDDGDEDDTSG